MWKFFKHQPGRTLVDPIQDAFFSTDSDDENARHLVRESIQNSLDAQRSGETVRVRFTFGELSTRYSSELFDGLADHLVANGSGLVSPPSVDQGMRFLAIEDFGTTGLVGDPDQLQDRDDQSEDNFYFFWRNVGRSGKRAGTLGKWGLGKTVFPASSRINTFFGLTRRPDDATSYLLGRCDIKTHRINGTQFEPYGYYAHWDNGKPMAISDPQHVELVRNAFHLGRQGADNTPGLSIIIPHVVEEFSMTMLREEVIENYFWPILNGQLVIEVQENYRTPPETTMNADWMRNEVESPSFRQDKRELADTIALASWAIDQDTPPITVRQSTASSSRWDEDTTISENDIEQLINKDNDFTEFSIVVPVKVNRKSSGTSFDSFKVYGKSVAYQTRRRSYLVRQGISVSGECATNPPQRIFIVVVDIGALADLLADAENPSHTHFERTDAVKENYQWGAMSTIRFVTGAPAAIAKMLDANDDESAATLFNDIFWKVPAVSEIPKPKKRRRKVVSEGETVPPKVNVTSIQRPFEIQRHLSGFRLTDNEKRERTIESITVKAGFDGGRGDAIKRHSKFDFDFQSLRTSGLTIDCSNCKYDILGHNEIRLSDVSEGFEFQIQGFDNNRDLTVRASTRYG